jgi:hypothetical protein
MDSKPVWICIAVALAGCGGDDGNGSGGSPTEPVFVLPGPPLVKVSAPTPFALGCDGNPVGQTVYADAEAEPFIAIDPTNPQRLVGAWQQDRTAGGGARGLRTAASSDGGQTWTLATLAASLCGGGNFDRASDPWVTFGADGTAHAMALALNTANDDNAMLAFRSTDGGQTWGPATTLIQTGSEGFNDKNSMTADPTDARYVYAVWDQLTDQQTGPTLFARSSDGGVTWEPARAIYDPGFNNQTLNNIVVVLPNGTLVNFFTEFRTVGSSTSGTLRVMRSLDKGTTWGLPITVTDLQSVGVSDPQVGTPIRGGSTLGAIAAGPNNDLVVAWMDARTNGGQRDGVLMKRSLDGGLTWLNATVVNSVPGTQAFTPAVAVRADGGIGVSYFDMRSDTESAATLGAQYWLAVSTNGGNSFAESEITVGPFDLALAPFARGLFLGDYMGLVVRGQDFLPFFVQTNNAGIVDRQDVYFRRVTPAIAERGVLHEAKPVGEAELTAAFQRAVSDNLRAVIESRPAWQRRKTYQENGV